MTTSKTLEREIQHFSFDNYVITNCIFETRNIITVLILNTQGFVNLLDDIEKLKDGTNVIYTISFFVDLISISTTKCGIFNVKYIRECKEIDKDKKIDKDKESNSSISNKDKELNNKDKDKDKESNNNVNNNVNNKEDVNYLDTLNSTFDLNKCYYDGTKLHYSSKVMKCLKSKFITYSEQMHINELDYVNDLVTKGFKFSVKFWLNNSNLCENSLIKGDLGKSLYELLMDKCKTSVKDKCKNVNEINKSLIPFDLGVQYIRRNYQFIYSSKNLYEHIPTYEELNATWHENIHRRITLITFSFPGHKKLKDSNINKILTYVQDILIDKLHKH
jgi:hypothetical protein